MRGRRPILALAAAGLLLAATHTASGQLPMQPLKASGEAVTAAYEGWYQNEDGTYSLLVGYFNRNLEEILDIPVGPDNRIEPGGPDYGQPTHFMPRKHHGVFAIRVPADFGNKKLTWTLVANGKETSIPLGLTTDYQVEPFREAAQGNTPPTIRMSPDGLALQGPPVGFAAAYTADAGRPLTLTIWASDDGQVDPDRRERAKDPVTIFWSKYRGPGEVTFSEPRPKVGPDGRTETTVTFGAPGEYWLRAQANDVSGDGGGGFQCCWTNAHVKVTVGGSR